MAETENSAPAKFDKDELKEWFTLTEVADHWTGLTGQTITENDLLHFGEQALLEVCFQKKMGSFGKSTPFSDENKTLHFWVYTYCRNNDILEHSYIHEKGFFVKDGANEYNCDLFALDTRSIKRFKSENEIQVRGGAIGEDHFEFGRTFFSAENPEGKDAFMAMPETIHKKDLVITKIERDRFEKERGINQPGMTAKMPEPDSEETEVRRLQRALGALVLGLAKKENPKWRTGNKPNVSAIVTTAMEAVQDDKGNTPYGYGSSTLTETINAALKACQKDTKP